MAALAGALLPLIPAAPVGASGGGGCGGPVTNERGTEIEIKRFCFKPTVLYAEPGDTVTWTNRDDVAHNVAGANLAWGSFESFREKRPVSYSFSKPGVFSYVCTIHPGMVGTVVVGDPEPNGAMASNSVRRIKRTSAVQSGPVRSGEAAGGAAWLATAAIFAALSGLLVGKRVRRARP
jgi:plastocyanin